jgi:hypothetical protein
MKKLFVFTITTFLILLICPDANAQVKGLLRDKAIEKIKQAQGHNEEEPSQPEQQQEQEQEPQQPARQQKKPGSSFLEKKMMGAMGLNNVVYEKQYNFTSSMMMEIETVDSLNQKDKVNYSTFFSPKDKSFALVFDAVNRETGKKEKSTIILDAKNWAMLILGDKDGERSGMAMYIAPDSSATNDSPTEVEQQAEDFIHPWYTPTGRSKTIAGFNCNEYTYSNEGGSVDLWVTKDQKLNFSNAYSYMNGFQALASGGWAYGMGMVMEMVFRDANSNASTHMLVKEILPDKSKFLDISSYQIIGIGGEQK